jgi:hypothetical protein
VARKLIAVMALLMHFRRFVHAGGVDVEHRQALAGADQVPGRRRAHHAQADETDVHARRQAKRNEIDPSGP